MDCVLLASGGMMPMPERLTTSVLVRRDGHMLMFDAGEGIQLALKRGSLGIRALDAIAITHLHADHVLGLPGVLMFRSQCDPSEPLTIIGPPGVTRFVRHTLEDLRYHVSFGIEFVEWKEGACATAWHWHGAALKWHELEHSTFCLGYRLEEPQRPGKFSLEVASAMDIPAGPLFGKLQRGEEIVDPTTGKIIRPTDVLGPPRRGRIVAYCTDTRPCDGLRQAIAGADLAFVEGMFGPEHAAEALQKRHMTVVESATAAAAAGSARTVLVHISPRYTLSDEPRLEAHAKAVLPTCRIGSALACYDVPLPD